MSASSITPSTEASITTLQKHVDFRVLEIGYGSLTTVSSADVGGGGTLNIPAANQLSFSSGFVFRF